MISLPSVAEPLLMSYYSWVSHFLPVAQAGISQRILKGKTAVLTVPPDRVHPPNPSHKEEGK